MRYMGGKTRIVSQIAAIMRARRGGRSTYVEPFIGGGSVAAEMAPRFEHVHLSDANEDLILLWQAIQSGWVPPTTISREQWWELKRATEPSALRAFAGFGASFGGAWFKSYAQDNPGNYYAGASSRTLRRYAPKIAHATIRHLDYAAAGEFIGPDAVVYCDPPYEGTTAYKAIGAFDTARFWDTARDWSEQGAAVMVSEYSAPADWTPVWKLKVPVTMNAHTNKDETLEQLFMYAPALEQLKKDRVNP